MLRVVIDTEYSARYQESGVAPLACLSYVIDDDRADAPTSPAVVGPREARALWAQWVDDPDVVIVAHSASSDVVALTANMGDSPEPGRGPWWEKAFRLYEANRVRCTEIRQRLLGTARGDFTKDDVRLATLRRYYFDEHVDADKKCPDDAAALLREGTPYEEWPADVLAATPWRFKFEMLADTPIADWPAEALAYARDDADAPRRIYHAQCEAIRGEQIVNEVERTRSAFDLHLLSLPGWRTDRPRVQRTMALYQSIIAACEQVTVASGITREKTYWAHKPDHPNHRTERSTNTKLVQLLVYQALGHDAPLTKAARKRGLSAADLTPEQHLANTGRDRGAISKAIVARQGKPVSFSEAISAYTNANADSGKDDARAGAEALTVVLRQSGDPDLNAYRIASYARKLTSAFLVNFDTDKRVRSTYTAVKATGRTSSRGSKTSYGVNIQQQPANAKGDVPPEHELRGCIVPDDDHILFGVDYQQVELAGLGHLLSVVIRNKTGDESYQSTLARAINGGRDCHAMVAAGLMGESYEYVLANKETDKTVKLMRKTAKPVNFGPPGGMGWRAFIDFALTSYDLVFTPEEAKRAIAVWKATWTETPDYFALINDMVRAGNGKATVQQLYSGRIRGNCTYTAAANSLFQGIAADGALAALTLIVDACYRSSPPWLADVSEECREAAETLEDYRVRPIAFIHDEFVAQQPDPLLDIAELDGWTKADRWAAYARAKDGKADDTLSAEIVRVAEEGMHALGVLMVEGMRKFIPDVAIRVDGKIFPDRWGK